MAAENEVQLGNDVYVFAPGTRASGFSSCLKKTLAFATTQLSGIQPAIWLYKP
jgi:hypothetical protein